VPTCPLSPITTTRISCLLIFSGIRPNYAS
jgi:hypothetical protein